MSRSVLTKLAFTMTVVATAVAAPTALAKDGDVRVAGTCTIAATSKLKLSPENGRIEVEFEVDQNRNGIPWRITVRRNGSIVATATATTRAPSGSFTVRRVMAASSGTDRIAAVATSPRGGTCRAAASF